MLLVGSTSFSGAHLGAAAERRGIEVIGTSRSGAGASVACDLLEPETLREAVRVSRPDAVANFAGRASVAESWENPGGSLETNAVGALNLLEGVNAEAPDAAVLCVSSAEVYGAADESSLPLTEDTPVNPVNPYGAGKAAMELCCRVYERARSMRIALVRPFNQIGPGQDDVFAVSSFAKQIAAAEHEEADEVELRVGNLSVTRDFTDVRDAARAAIVLLEGGITGTVNLCSARPVQLTDVVEKLSALTPLPVKVRTDEARTRPVDAPAIWGSNARLRKATGWQPEIQLDRTLADLLDSWREQLAGG